MARCELTDTCIFFNELMADMPSAVGTYKMLYCEDNFQSCARYIIRQELGKEAVPVDLFPHQKDRIDKILKHHKAILV